MYDYGLEIVLPKIEFYKLLIARNYFFVSVNCFLISVK